MSDFKFYRINISLYKISCGLFLNVYSCALLHFSIGGIRKSRTKRSKWSSVPTLSRPATH